MEEPMLPGLNLSEVVSASERYEDLSEDKKATAERVLALHPERYAIAARLFFEFNASKRSICDICKIGIHTVNAIIERELLSRGGEILAKRGKTRKSMIKMQIIEEIEEAIQDGALGDFKLDEKIKILEKWEKLTEQSAEGEDKKNPSGNTSKPEIIDADYSEISDGLNS